jgi:hypothetical protein
MRGTGPVTVGKELLYAYFTVEGGMVRVRVSTDDRDRLDLFPGKQVLVGIDGEAERALGVTSKPPFVWVEFEMTSARKAD